MVQVKSQWQDLFIGLLGPLITVAGIAIGVLQFNQGENNRVESEHAFRLWTDRVEAYHTVIRLAGAISSDPSGPKAADNIDQFNAAYWGEMILVEDRTVACAMIAYRSELLRYLDQFGSQQQLAAEVDRLAAVMKASLAARDGWKPLAAANVDVRCVDVLPPLKSKSSK
jgi:hypothetical protein